MPADRKKASPRKRPTIQIEDGEWYSYAWNDQHEECCGCGLRHSLDYRVIDGELQIRARRLED